MQGMADGGIVAFAGEGPSFVQDMSPDAINERYRLGELQKIKDLFGITGARRGYQSGFTPEEKQAGMQAPAVPSPANPKPYEPYETGFTGSNVLTPPVLQAPPPQLNLTSNTNLARAAAPRPATPEVGFAERLKKALGTNPDEDRFAKRREEITNTAKTGAETGLASLKADQATDMAEMFKGREARIGKREGELEKFKDTNTGMAFLEAGLAMMQARGPGLAAIAQGAGVGVKQYSSGIKDIKAAQEKLDDARDRIEELRQNQTSMNKREIRVEEKGIRDLVTQGQRETLAGAEKAYGIKREDMRAAVNSDIAVRESALDRQNKIQVAGMPGDQQKMLTALGGKGGLEAGLKKFQEAQADKSGTAMAKLFFDTNTQRAKESLPPYTPTQFSLEFNSVIGGIKPPPLSKTPTGVVIP
jgi:hypothetical protein